MCFHFERVAILGVGLIGGSFGMAIKKQGLAVNVIGIDIDKNNLREAKKLNAIDYGYSSPNEALNGVDLMILAAPISINLTLLNSIKPYLNENTIITDVGSTKGQFVKECEKVIGNKGTFIGGHPMAGSEIAGIKGADPYLFENAVYLLTPTEKVNKKSTDKMKDFLKAIGAKVFLMNPDEHDFLVAAVSHLPHVIASNLVNTVNKVQGQNSNTLLLAAGGFRDTTRIASGNPELWRDICYNNKDKLLKVIDMFKSTLEELKESLIHDKHEAFYESLRQAKQVRDEIPIKLKGYWPFLEEVIVMIPDRPGMIAHVASVLGREGINIDDIEILRVREGEGGSLRLGFACQGSSSKAIAILNKKGIVAREK